MKYILLVEDDPFLLDIYTTKLKEEKFIVKVAKDGQEAINKIKEEKPGLLLLDIVLPHINGWEVLKIIKNDPEFKKIPVIVLSNLGQKSEVEKTINLGADKFLIKAHYTPSQVITEINKIIKKNNIIK